MVPRMSSLFSLGEFRGFYSSLFPYVFDCFRQTKVREKYRIQNKFRAAIRVVAYALLVFKVKIFSAVSPGFKKVKL